MMEGPQSHPPGHSGPIMQTALRLRLHYCRLKMEKCLQYLIRHLSGRPQPMQT